MSKRAQKAVSRFDFDRWDALTEAVRARGRAPEWLAEAMERLADHREAFGVKSEGGEVEFIYPH